MLLELDDGLSRHIMSSIVIRNYFDLIMYVIFEVQILVVKHLTVCFCKIQKPVQSISKDLF